ncbi:hypothetical protein H8959_007442 [Pygathrix nigripes]
MEFNGVVLPNLGSGMVLKQTTAQWVEGKTKKQTERGDDFPKRKAISRAGLQHLAPAHPLSLPVANGPAKEPRATLDWSENAVNGEHLWLETNVSGDLCYLGEENCQVRFAKSALRRKCAVCKIVVHTACIEQLEKINFRCKPTFREGGSRSPRESKSKPSVLAHVVWPLPAFPASSSSHMDFLSV